MGDRMDGAPVPTEPSVAGRKVLEQLLTDRFSCRAYRPDPVPRAVSAGMFALAQRTATWCNVQPWEVVVTEGEGTERFRKALLEAARRGNQAWDIPPPVEYTGAYRERRREAGFALYGALGIDRGDHQGRQLQSAENFRLFGAPHVAVISALR